MSREVKFRGKDIRNNEWVYGGYYKHLKRTPSPIRDSIKDCDYEHLIIKSGFSDWNMPKPLECFIVEEKTVGECTGLKDKNSVEIYEGDILRRNNNDKDLVQVKFGEFLVYELETEEAIEQAYGWYLKVISTDELSELKPFCYDAPLNKYWIDKLEIEVIGNIYEDKLEG